MKRTEKLFQSKLCIFYEHFCNVKNSSRFFQFFSYPINVAIIKCKTEKAGTVVPHAHGTWTNNMEKHNKMRTFDIILYRRKINKFYWNLYIPKIVSNINRIPSSQYPIENIYPISAFRFHWSVLSGHFKKLIFWWQQIMNCPPTVRRNEISSCSDPPSPSAMTSFCGQALSRGGSRST